MRVWKFVGGDALLIEENQLVWEQHCNACWKILLDVVLCCRECSESCLIGLAPKYRVIICDLIFRRET